MTGGRVLVTGVADPLGGAIAERMATRANVEIVIGVTRVTGAAGPAIDGVDVVGLEQDYTGIADLLQSRAIDTIIHADRPWSLAGSGRDGTGEHVIATMQLAAAAAHREATVRRVVMVSSTRVYPASARAPLLYSESEPLQPRRGGLAAALVEAEGFVRDLATENPNLSVSILRFADLAGPGTHDPLATLLASPVAPAVWGFDPPVQLLDVDDAVAALEHASDHDLAGVYNVAADGLVRWRRAARLARTPLIELPVTPSTLLTTMLRWSYRLDAADDILAVLRYGRRAAIDAFTRSGFQPTRTTEQCVPRPADRAAPDGPAPRGAPVPRRLPPNRPATVIGGRQTSSPITAR
jgi:UDP-glucose 4-epimerase